MLSGGEVAEAKAQQLIARESTHTSHGSKPTTVGRGGLCQPWEGIEGLAPIAERRAHTAMSHRESAEADADDPQQLPRFEVKRCRVQAQPLSQSSAQAGLLAPTGDTGR